MLEAILPKSIAGGIILHLLLTIEQEKKEAKHRYLGKELMTQIQQKGEEYQNPGTTHFKLSFGM